MNPSFFIFGFGYTAAFFSRKLAELGFEIVGTTRNQSKKSPPGLSSVTLIDFEATNIEDYLSLATHILVSIPPITGVGDLVLSHFSQQIKRHAPHIQWLGYLSSTGVYGDHQGEWVDEKSICRPQSPSGILRLEAEQAWLSFAKDNQLPLHVFRISGIYGPGRNALARIKAGKKFSLFKEGQVFSRIHVEDIVSVLIASINHVHPLSIYNVADDEPESSQVVDAHATSLLGRSALPVIRIEDAALSSMEQEFYSSNRRVSNLKIKTELHVVLQYPSFREGLAQINSAGL